MNTFRMMALTSALVLALAATAVWAQPASAPGPGPGPGMGMGPGSGPMGGGPMGGRWGRGNTPGWSMMTDAERAEHRDRMRAMKDYGECKAYADKHHEQMVARARERGRATPDQPRRDPCASLK